MLDKVKSYIEQQGLLRREGRHLVAVSGGADSVCLLLALQQLGYSIEAVHCNFMLRGDESRRDERFVTDLCKRIGIALHLASFDTRTFAALHGVSIEMAARQLRYAFFEQLRQDIGADDICVAHHQDDSAETVLLNILRGTGISGLTGIQPRRGHIVRPLLCVCHDEIVEWLQEQGQTFVTDSTNLEADAKRNFLRLNVLPVMCQAMPTVRESILNTARHLAEAKKVYDAAMQQALSRLQENVASPYGLNGCAISIASLLAEPSPESLLFEWLHPLGFNAPTIEEVCRQLPTMKMGREWTSATHLLFTHQQRLVVTQHPAERPMLRLPDTGLFVYDTDYRLRVERQQGAIVRRDADSCCLDADKVAFPLLLRPIRKGDRFVPFGMRGSKLVSDYLTDRHLSAPERRLQLVVTDAHGDIVWLVAHRPDARYCIGADTQQTLLLEFRSSQS